ncbi:hypothetical protein [Pinibacter aurantiacus]|uniref:DUF5041 domain-containing protein n=1 Tax=Pinibacter aurantiacus TaxID=2851599 RepID=A0A9E2SE58_9BACT|nr:hypothetical protein [Pinibacter aurantiacus]MBV4358360.1 hypothetical protein [Pinibacter aurantiacus]
MKKIIILLFSFFSFSAHSQSIDDKVASEVTALRRKGVSMVVRFDNDRHGVPAVYKIQGLGEVMVDQEIYLFYKFNQQDMVMKCINYYDSTGSNSYVATLPPLTISCDSLLGYASRNLGKFKGEKIYPFIYKWKHDGDSSYSWLWGSHPTDLVIEIYLEADYFRNNLRLDDVDQFGPKKEVENLNYAHNSNTATYKIFLMIKDLVEPIERKFSYKETND